MNKVNATSALIILFLVIFTHIVIVNLAPESSPNSSYINPTTYNIGLSPSVAIISVDPPTSKAMVNQSFMININISDIADLYGWEFKLGWNSTVLEAISVVEGPFLRQGGDTFFWSKINNTEGYLLADCTLLGNMPGVTGNGTLSTIELHVKAKGESILHLYDTKLINSLEQPINHTAIDGYYYTTIHDVAIINLVASETTVYVTVENQGTETETFDVSVYYTRLADPLIGTQTVTLTRGANTTLTFTWTPPTTGRYKIRAEASVVPGEVDTADNTLTTIISICQSGSVGGLGGFRKS